MVDANDWLADVSSLAQPNPLRDRRRYEHGASVRDVRLEKLRDMREVFDDLVRADEGVMLRGYGVIRFERYHMALDDNLFLPVLGGKMWEHLFIFTFEGGEVAVAFHNATSEPVVGMVYDGKPLPVDKVVKALQAWRRKVLYGSTTSTSTSTVRTVSVNA